MGRAKIILSHVRNMQMEMSAKFFRYSIPLNNEREQLGKLISAEIKNNELIITYENKGDYPAKEVPEPNFVISFS